jgi:small subunit ribosomal protein S17
MELEVRKKQVVKGVVVSDKMSKTRVIEVAREIPHRLYAKKTERHTRLFVHDEKNESKVGDVVLAVYSRPLSKLKNFRLTKILEKGSVA